MFTKKTIIAFILTICLVAATPISVFSGMGDDVQQIDQAGDDLMSSSGFDDLETTDIVDEPTDGIDEPTDSTDEPIDGTDEPNSGTDEPDDGIDEPTGGTDELDNNTDEPTDETDELDGEPDESAETAEPDRPDDMEELDEEADTPTDETDEAGETNGAGETDELGDEANEPADETGEPIENELLIFRLAEEEEPDLMSEDTPVKVETRQELLNVFNTGAVSDGDSNWSGTRIVEIAFDNFGTVITPNSPAEHRTIILRSADSMQRNIAINFDNRHFNIGNNITLVIDDDNLHFVGRALDNRVGGGVNVADGATLIINGGTFKNCRAGSGGGVYVADGGTLLLNGGVIENGLATNGGGVFVIGANALFEMYGGIISGNTATDGGAGVHLDITTTFNMYDGIIRANKIPTAGTSGGGVRVRGNSLFNMQGGIIEDNEVLHTGQYAYGGAVCIGEVNQDTNISTFNMNGGIIRNNKSQWGGGVAAFNGYFNLGTGRIERSAAPDNQGGNVYAPIISGNEARGNEGWSTNPQIGFGGGGGVWAYDVFGATYSFVMHSGIITGNETRYRGGGVFINRTDCVILGGEISNNHTTDNGNTNAAGGGVYLHTNDNRYIPKFAVSNAVISGNSSRNGGGIARTTEVPVEISNNTVISGNTADLVGGGIHTGTPSSATVISANSIGLSRNNIDIDSTVRFEGNRSLSPTSLALTVSQVSDHAPTLHSKIHWSGKNSARGVRENSGNYHLFNNHDIGNLQGIEVVNRTTLSISETTVGEFSNMLKEFDFTVTFTDSDGRPLPQGTQFNYQGSIIDNSGAIAPQNGVLDLDSSGSATFTLGHGQVIIIEDVPLDSFVQVAEKLYDGYITSHTDSEYAAKVVESNDTTLLEMTENREFNFTNERFFAPPTGVASDDIRGILLLVGLVALIGMAAIVTSAVCRRCR